ncbi:MAG: hypothetical protein KGL39_24200 [Patescibacteria group bacterium]|nr:hypothetical protein [Patescibacteria group bacterium]
MTVYNSNKVGATPKYLDDAAGVNTIATYMFPTTGTLPTLNTGDTFVMMPIPAGMSMMDCELDIDKLDGAGTTLVVSVGDSGNPARFITGATAGRAGGYVGPNVNGWTGLQYSVTTNIVITVTAGASGAVPAGAGLRLFVSYTADP